MSTCANEECDKEARLSCARCKDIRYCSKSCQLICHHWHKKCCIEPHKIAFNLMKTVYADDFDVMSEALKVSYGFERCKTQHDKVYLLGLYQGLIKYLDCDINEIDKAFNENKLPELLVTMFYNKTRPENGGAYFKWFIQDLERCRH